MKQRGVPIIMVALAVLTAGGLAACGPDRPAVAAGGAALASALATTAPATTAPATTPPAATPPATTPPATSAAPPPAHLPVLGPYGYGALRLGMTRSQAAATGLTEELSATGFGACGGPGDGHLRGAPAQGVSDADGRLIFSARTGKLVAIYAFRGVRTPKKIGLESSFTALHTAYPDWVAITGGVEGHGSAKVPGNAQAHYRIAVANHTVIQLSIDANNQDCYE